MITIPLNNGYSALVDDEDFDLVKGYRWYADVYPNVVYARAKVRTSKVSTVLMHRIIKNPSAGVIIDHKDRNGLNNTRDNLRCTDKKGNAINTPPRPAMYSQFKGVTWDKARSKWKSMIATKNLGRFNTEIEAAQAYNNAALEIYGEFAFLNSLSSVEVPCDSAA